MSVRYRTALSPRRRPAAMCADAQTTRELGPIVSRLQAWYAQRVSSPGTALRRNHWSKIMSHQPPKENKKKPVHTAKEKKIAKQQKRHANDAPPFIKH